MRRTIASSGTQQLEEPSGPPRPIPNNIVELFRALDEASRGKPSRMETVCSASDFSPAGR